MRSCLLMGCRFCCVIGALLLLWSSTTEVLARQNIRDAFFTAYPDAIGSAIETVPSFPNHCGVCHFAFAGGGTRNPYGLAVEGALPSFPSNPNGRQQAILSVENQDSDGDGFSTLIEVTDTLNFSNTPTFPGLTPGNVGNVSGVDITEIQGHLVPSTGGDTTPPEVTVIAPNGGEILVGNWPTTVEWSATDESGIAAVSLYVSYDNGVTFMPEALGLQNTGSLTWFPDNRPTTEAILRAIATDNAFNHGQDDSDDAFTIEPPPGGLAPTTLRDFDMPGSQPFEAGILNPPEACAVCHGNYDASVEPFQNWRGSMMAQASRDLLMEALLTIANQDAPDSGDLCLRCHLPRGWLQGRSVPTDGSQMLDTDGSGVACDLCHRMVDPFYDPAENPIEDAGILGALRDPPVNAGSGMYVVDPTGARRGPFVDADSGHPVLVSPFHREAAFCGTCHDVSNPAFEKDGNGNYVPNAFDAPATDFSAHTIAPVERTYSEWFYSDYNTPEGIYAPEFGGNKDYVSTCQDCHMRDVTGQGANFSNPPVRDDLPLHDMTGGSTWYPSLLPTLYPGEVDETALQAGIARARYMLQNAAEVVAVQEGTQVKVTVTNQTGHKLPSGYPEGRRIWINVRFYDEAMALVGESGAYDPATGVLTHDAAVKIYETKPGLDEVTAPLVGVDPGPSFHFVLNNKIFKDNRIPPRGFTNAAYAGFGGAPVEYSYADGQYWDDTFYAIPAGAMTAEVTLYYQSTSKEFMEFLRDENTTNSLGQEMFDLWNENGKCPPEPMETATLELVLPQACCLPDGTCQDLEPSACETQGGTVHAGEICSALEACCVPGEECQMLDPLCCTDQGGVPLGPGTACTQPEACCLAGGACEMLDPLCCTDLGGDLLYVGSACLGDGDGSGVDDACEPPKRPMPEDCATIAPGTRCSAGGTCTEDSDCAFESHCVPPPAGEPLQAVCYAPKARYLSVARHATQVPFTARRVRLDTGQVLGWVGVPTWATPTSQHDGLWLADVVASPYYAETWPDLVHVHTCRIAHASLCNVSGQHCLPNGCPNGEICEHHCYQIQAISLGDDIGNEADYSEALELCTPKTWGDTVGNCQGNICTPPNGVVGLDDVQAEIKYYGNNRVAPITWLDIEPSNGSQSPNQNIGIGDILNVIDGFQGKAYPGAGPLACP